VYEVHDWAEVHRLFDVEGLSKARIAEKLEMSRNTVSRLLVSVEPPVYERESTGSKLDPYKGSIQHLLGEDPKAPATVIIERLRREGYEGGITILKDYLVGVRPLFVGAKAFQRTSYLPGEIGQCDWWEPPLSIPVGKGASRQVYGLVITLPQSAAHACVFSFSKQMIDFLPAFSGSLGRLGGVPDKMVLDRDSAIVVPGSRPARVHDEIAALFGAFRVRPVIVGPRRPESKGQVERTNGYLERSFLPLRKFTGLDDLQTQHDQWATEIAFRRYHRRVGARVGDAFRAEQGFLHPLPDHLPDTDRHTEVRVTKDGFCRFGDVDYSVPPGYGGRRLQIRGSWSEVVIFSEGREVARHRRSFVPADVVLDPTHALALRLARQAQNRLNAADVDVGTVDLTAYDHLVGVDS
jgi:transposase